MDPALKEQAGPLGTGLSLSRLDECLAPMLYGALTGSAKIQSPVDRSEPSTYILPSG